MEGKHIGSMLEWFGLKECITAPTSAHGEALQKLDEREKMDIDQTHELP